MAPFQVLVVWGVLLALFSLSSAQKQAENELSKQWSAYKVKYLRNKIAHTKLMNFLKF
jgi:hypothetical protein